MRRRCVCSYKIRLSGFTPNNPTGFTMKGSKSKVALLLPGLNFEKSESSRVPAAKDAAAMHSEASSGTRTIFYARRRRRVVMVEGRKKRGHARRTWLLYSRVRARAWDVLKTRYILLGLRRRRAQCMPAPSPSSRSSRSVLMLKPTSYHLLEDSCKSLETCEMLSMVLKMLLEGAQRTDAKWVDEVALVGLSHGVQPVSNGSEFGTFQAQIFLLFIRKTKGRYFATYV